ncbi:hypothetical protein OCL94_07885 [Macrococcus sp. TMW 2.2395]|nr:hypothetical protein [Macrococcus sp. TMW 2.2395]
MKERLIGEKIEKSIKSMEQGKPLYDARSYVAELKRKYGEVVSGKDSIN